MIFAECIGVNQTMGVSLFDFLNTAVYPSAFCGGVRNSLGECVANFVASCGKPYKKQVKLMDCILQTHDIIDRCMEMKENADDLQTFREGFRGLCWSYGANILIIMLYLLMIQMRDES